MARPAKGWLLIRGKTGTSGEVGGEAEKGNVFFIAAAAPRLNYSGLSQLIIDGEAKKNRAIRLRPQKMSAGNKNARGVNNKTSSDLQ